MANTKEQELGLTSMQKTQLENAGLSKQEINTINKNRILEGIAKEREMLDKLEAKYADETAAVVIVGKAVAPKTDAEIALEEDDDYLDEEQDGEMSAADQAKEDESIRELWEGKNVFTTNDDYYKAVTKAIAEHEAKGEVLPPEPEPEDEDFDAKWEAYAKAYMKIAAPLIDLRWRGIYKANYDWQKNGRVGEPPDQKLPEDFTLFGEYMNIDDPMSKTQGE